MPSLRLRAALCSLALLGLPGVGHSQELAKVEADNDLPGFRNRIEALYDIAALGQIADSLENVDLDSGTALRLALVRLRQDSLGDPHAIRQAEQMLNRAVINDYDNPDLWYTIGRLRSRMAERGVFAKSAPLMGDGAGYIGGATAAWFRVLELDPSRQDAALALAGLVGKDGFLTNPETLLSILERATGIVKSDTTMLGQLMTVEKELWDYPAAESAWHRYRSAGGGASMLVLVPQDQPNETRLEIARSFLHPTAEIFRLQTDLLFAMAAHNTAAVANEQYVMEGGDSAIYVFNRARIEFATGKPNRGRVDYYDGVRLARDTSAIALYREDIALVADSAELAAWDALPATERAEWLRDFWRSRDVADGRPLGTRLIEHRRRIVYAYEHYPMPSSPPRPLEWALSDESLRDLSGAFERAGDTDDEGMLEFEWQRRIHRIKAPTGSRFDDRGLIYIRHGAPLQTANYPGIGHWYSETWKYSGPEGTMVMHFDDPDGLPLRMYLVDGPADFMAACALDSSYCIQAAEFAMRFPDIGRSWRKKVEVQRTAERALQTDGNPRFYPTPFHPVVQMYGMPGKVLAVFAIPGADLLALDSTPRRAYPLNLRLSAASSDGAVIMQSDTAGTVTTGSPLDSGEWIASTVELPVAPGEYLVSLAVSDTSNEAGATFRLPGLTVSAFGTDRLAISDLILGLYEGGLPWTGQGETIALNPLNSYPQGSSAELYYQVDGQVPGRKYLTRIEVRKDDGDPMATLEFREAATAPRTWYRRSVGLARIRPGSYRLIVTIQDPETGEVQSREQRLNVNK